MGILMRSSNMQQGDILLLWCVKHLLDLNGFYLIYVNSFKS